MRLYCVPLIHKMNKKYFYFLLLLGLLAFTPSILPLNDEVQYEEVENDCYTENSCFQKGEKVVYKVYYNWNFIWLPAGEVTFNVNESDTEYRISAIGRTYSSYEWFFKVRDYYYSYIDKSTFLPHTFIRDIEEGDYKLYDRIKFDQNNLQGSSLRGKTKEESKLQEFKFDNCMHDVLSIIYKMRNLEYGQMKENSSIPVKIFLDMETYPLNIKLKGKEKKTWIKGQGYFKTLKISPELIAGNVFAEGQQMNVWVSDDKNRIPLMIESPVSVGSLKVVLKNYEGLKFDLSSKIE